MFGIANALRRHTEFQRGLSRIQLDPPPPSSNGHAPSGDLERFFDNRKEGRGIWKWRHYFPIYERHLSRFRGTDVRLVEIGIYSGGSLEMWRDYFGPNCSIVGTDIVPECRNYANEFTSVEIGDQGDPGFWSQFRKKYPRVDVLIDDGSHRTDHQMTTLEEMLNHLSPGGVYICEDIHGDNHWFSVYVSGLMQRLHPFHEVSGPEAIQVQPTPFQQSIASICVYPFAVVIEKTQVPTVLECPKHGTTWNPNYQW